MKASIPVTWCPPLSSSSHRCEPMNPAAPVTTYFIADAHSQRTEDRGQKTDTIVSVVCPLSSVLCVRLVGGGELAVDLVQEFIFLDGLSQESGAAVLGGPLAGQDRAGGDDHGGGPDRRRRQAVQKGPA